MTRALSPLLGLLPLLACTTAPTSTQDLTVIEGVGDMDKNAVIYGGSAPSTAAHDATVALHQLTSDGASVYVSPFCTGTLIAPDVVLTAAHCMDTARGGGSYRTMSPSQLAVYVGDEPAVDILDHLYGVVEIEINSAYNRRAIRNDIALIRLSSAITEAVTPVPILPAAEGFDAGDFGETLNFAGFGETESGASGVKLQVDGELGGLGCSVSGCGSSGDSATQISYVQGDGGPCFGDSGGPAFVVRGGTTYVGGITSYGDSYCTIYGVSTRVDAFESWITTWIGDGGDSGTPGDGGAGDGGAGDGGAGTCGDGVCGTGESCDGRDGTSACSADCDGVTTGKPSNRYCEVEGVCEGPGC